MRTLVTTLALAAALPASALAADADQSAVYVTDQSDAAIEALCEKGTTVLKKKHHTISKVVQGRLQAVRIESTETVCN